MFRILIAFTILVAIAGCGVETVATGATAAAAKQKELENARKSIATAQEEVQKAAELQQKSAEKAAEVDK